MDEREFLCISVGRRLNIQLQESVLVTSEMGNVLYRSDIRRESDKRVYGNLLHRAWHSLALTFRYYCSGIMLAMLAGLLWHHATIISVYLEKIIHHQPQPRIHHSLGWSDYSQLAESLTDPC